MDPRILGFVLEQNSSESCPALAGENIWKISFSELEEPQQGCGESSWAWSRLVLLVQQVLRACSCSISGVSWLLNFNISIPVSWGTPGDTLGQGSSGFQQPGLDGLENNSRDGMIRMDKADSEFGETAAQLVGFWLKVEKKWSNCISSCVQNLSFLKTSLLGEIFKLDLFGKANVSEH